MAIILGSIILLLIVLVAYKGSKSQPKKTTYIIWGITTMLAIAPLLSWIVSFLYAKYTDNGLAGIELITLLFPLLFLIGVILLLIGLLKKH